MVNFDKLRQISHSTSMIKVLDYYNIDYSSTGNNRYKIVCPFHNDHDPSLVIYTNDDHMDESFCCYVDNIAGDSFLFIRRMENNDFNKAWSVLCHINGIADTDAQSIDGLDLLFQNTKTQSVDTRSIAKINYEISTLYRDLGKKHKESLHKQHLQGFYKQIDKRFQQLDNFLTSNPSFSEMQSFFKQEMEVIKRLQKQANDLVKTYSTQDK